MCLLFNYETCKQRFEIYVHFWEKVFPYTTQLYTGDDWNLLQMAFIHVATFVLYIPEDQTQCNSCKVIGNSTLHIICIQWDDITQKEG
jgi:hypothetical protein